jgi:hypothetical protein
LPEGALGPIVVAVKVETRDRSTGRYSYSGDFDRLCKCGHTLGAHTAEPPHECINGDTGEACDCARFVPARRK